MSFLLLLVMFITIIVICVLLIPSVCSLIIICFKKLFYRDTTMNIKPQNNHQIRVITLEDGNFKDETLYRVKKG